MEVSAKAGLTHVRDKIISTKTRADPILQKIKKNGITNSHKTLKVSPMINVVDVDETGTKLYSVRTVFAAEVFNI